MSIVEETTESWLECRLDKGMFSDEVAVTWPATGEMRKSVFVPADCVRGHAGSTGAVRVVLVRRNGELMAVLPSSRKDIVVISENDITQ